MSVTVSVCVDLSAVAVSVTIVVHLCNRKFHPQSQRRQSVVMRWNGPRKETGSVTSLFFPQRNTRNIRCILSVQPPSSVYPLAGFVPAAAAAYRRRCCYNQPRGHIQYNSGCRQPVLPLASEMAELHRCVYYTATGAPE